MMEKFKETLVIIIVLLCLVALVVVAVYGPIHTVNNWNRITDAYDKPIGKQIIIDKDTFTIVSSNDWVGTFTLSNGVKVDSSFIKTRVIN